eukprot:COSAG04_NODE_304_length_17311_cov_13.648792_16_plen_363_part_00
MLAHAGVVQPAAQRVRLRQGQAAHALAGDPGALGGIAGRAAPWWSNSPTDAFLRSESFGNIIGDADTTTAIILCGVLLACLVLLVAQLSHVRQGASYWGLFMLSAQITYFAWFGFFRGLQSQGGPRAAAQIGVTLDSDQSIRFGDLTLSPQPTCCDPTQRSWVQEHDTHHCVAPECLGFFVANEDWARRGLTDRDDLMEQYGAEYYKSPHTTCAGIGAYYGVNADTGCAQDLIKVSPNCHGVCAANPGSWGPSTFEELCPQDLRHQYDGGLSSRNQTAGRAVEASGPCRRPVCRKLDVRRWGGHSRTWRRARSSWQQQVAVANFLSRPVPSGGNESHCGKPAQLEHAPDVYTELFLSPLEQR